MGHYSTFGVTFVCEVITGRLIDFELTQKCTRCGEKSDDFSDNGNCVYGLFHGCPGSMEIHNALILLKRSTLWGFRYTEYVSDGDAKVLPHLRRANIYLDVNSNKIECGNHMAKRGCSAIYKFGSTWKPSPSGEPPVQPGKRGRKVMYPLKKFFSWNRCFDLSQRYKLAVYQNQKQEREAQSKAVKAIFFS